MAYPVIEVPLDASTQLEQLGTKGKFWYRDEYDRQVLFKVGIERGEHNLTVMSLVKIADQLQVKPGENFQKAGL